MIRFIDATVLALTKLRTHKIRTAITVIIPSLLFGILFAVLIMSEGVFNSFSNFNKEGYGSRFIIGANPIPFDDYKLMQDKTIITRAKEIYRKAVADKKAAAQKLGVPYDESSEIPPIFNYTGKIEDEYLSTGSPYAIQALKENIAQNKVPDMEILEKITAGYKTKGIYTIEAKANYLNEGSLTYMKDGKESFINTNNIQPVNDYSVSSIELIFKQFSGFSVMSKEITDTFLLPEKYQVSPTNPDSIPVIVSYSVAEKMLNLLVVKDATPKQQLDRISEIQQKAGTINFTTCYRNNISKQQIDQAVAVAAEIDENKNNKDYQKPSLIYQLPAEDSCAAASIKTDTRSSEEKAIALKTKQFNKQFGVVDEPEQQKIYFHIVGLSPNQPDFSQTVSAFSLFQSIFGTSSTYALQVPGDQYDRLPSAEKYNKILSDINAVFVYNKTYAVEFNSANDATDFINKYNCDQYETCQENNKLFSLYAYGSNSIALDSIKTTFLKAFAIATLVIVIIAAIIMSGTLGRLVADGRRETAVFRAIGFKRIDIASIYITYIFVISLIIIATSALIGFTASYVIDFLYWQDFTVQSLLIFGASDINRQFHFISIDLIKLTLVLAAIVTSGLISTILPLIRNLRRNPIKDMRDE
jgi:ABC-type antimicrobial peptide transport system permease subunit